MFSERSFSKDFYQTCLRGFQQMSPEARNSLAETVAENQGPNGLFCGRAGQEDLYYTYFGLLLALVSGAKIRRQDCSRNVLSHDFSKLDLVHACAWLRATRMLHFLAVPGFIRGDFLISTAIVFSNTIDSEVLKKLEYVSTLPPDAYPQQDVESPYSRFLLGTLYSDYGRSFLKYNLDPYRLRNGLFTNVRNGVDYGLNATTAALFLLAPDESKITVRELLKLQERDGSFKATASTPSGDLMSTATAIFAIHKNGQSPTISVKQFLRDCFRDDALFAATPDDPDGDLEYTVYGLLAMGAIS